MLKIKEKKIKWFFLFHFLVGTFFMSVSFYAHASGGADFSVRPIIPENQKTPQSYYELELEPGEHQRLVIEVFNESDETIKVKSELNRATTADVGTIYYQKTDKLDKSVQVNIEELVEINKQIIEIPANGKKNVEWDIIMPEENFNGIILGGFRFTLLEDGEEESVGIQNKFAYTIGLILQNSSEEQPVNLNLISIEPGQVNFRNHVLINLQNDQARIIDNLAIQADVFQEDSEKPIYSGKSEGLRMAPNSAFNFGVSTNETAFQPGLYRLEMKAIADGKEFNWTKKFEITKKSSELLNQEAILQDVEDFSIWMWIAFGACSVLVIGSLFIIVYMKKQKKRKTPTKD